MIEIFKGGLICLGVTGRGDAQLIKGADSEGVGWVEGGWGRFSPSNEAQRPPPSLPRAIKKRTASAADRCHISASWVVRFPPTDHGRIAVV